tara:strand:+ start:28 stop:879 length:852 start_codon:yes stop_codon:yes gene_type:complete
MNNFAIIGVGRWGQILLKSFSKKVKFKKFASSGNCKNTIAARNIEPSIVESSLNNILNDTEIQNIIIATPLESLYRIARDSVIAGKNIFLEKPGALNASQVNELKILCTENQALYINYLYACDPIFEKIKALVSSEEILEIKCFWKKSSLSNQDILLNLACHDIFLVTNLLKCNDVSILKKKIEKSQCHVELSIDNKLIKIFIDSSSNQREKRFYIKTKKNVLLWDIYNKKLFINGKETFCSAEDLVDKTRDKFLDMIVNQTKEGYSKSRTVMTLDIIEKIRK